MYLRALMWLVLRYYAIRRSVLYYRPVEWLWRWWQWQWHLGRQIFDGVHYRIESVRLYCDGALSHLGHTFFRWIAKFFCRWQIFGATLLWLRPEFLEDTFADPFSA